ncbi:MAG TPA: regulatory protein RecX [Prolixibacteraceae bacterium]|nr:regulatory protein RecX [Prolixibacteraceae bacterium]
MSVISTKEALEKAMALCAQSEKCRSEIAEKLFRWGLDETQTEIVLKELIEQKFIDENRYSLFYVRDKFRFNRWGKVKMAYLLRQKKIPDLLIQDALSDIDDEAYLDALKILLNQYARKKHFKNEYDKKARLTRFALSRGFEYGPIEQALNDL